MCVGRICDEVHSITFDAVMAVVHWVCNKWLFSGSKSGQVFVLIGHRFYLWCMRIIWDSLFLGVLCCAVFHGFVLFVVWLVLSIVCAVPCRCVVCVCGWRALWCYVVLLGLVICCLLVCISIQRLRFYEGRCVVQRMRADVYWCVLMCNDVYWQTQLPIFVCCFLYVCCTFCL